MKIKIQDMKKEHWDQVKRIYIEGIASGNATFQSEAPTWKEWDEGHISNCRFIATMGNEIIGWTAISSVSGRCVYVGVAEVSVYVGKEYIGRGVGRKLLQVLIKQSEENGFWTLQAGIFPENTASIKLHTKLGFREVGIRERIGKLNGEWRNVVLLERRSNIQ